MNKASRTNMMVSVSSIPRILFLSISVVFSVTSSIFDTELDYKHLRQRGEVASLDFVARLVLQVQTGERVERRDLDLVTLRAFEPNEVIFAESFLHKHPLPILRFKAWFVEEDFDALDALDKELPRAVTIPISDRSAFYATELPSTRTNVAKFLALRDGDHPVLERKRADIFTERRFLIAKCFKGRESPRSGKIMETALRDATEQNFLEAVYENCKRLQYHGGSRSLSVLSDMIWYFLLPYAGRLKNRCDAPNTSVRLVWSREEEAPVRLCVFASRLREARC